jgi:hypothetical protein
MIHLKRAYEKRLSGRLLLVHPARLERATPLIRSAFRGTPAGYGSYDLLTSVTGCSRQRVYLLPPITSSLSVFLSQVCLKLLAPLNGQRILSPLDTHSDHFTTHYQVVFTDVSAVKASYVWLGYEHVTPLSSPHHSGHRV